MQKKVREVNSHFKYPKITKKQKTISFPPFKRFKEFEALTRKHSTQTIHRKIACKFS